MTEQQMREYLESVWEESCVESYSGVHYVSLAPEVYTSNFSAKVDAFRAAIEFTERRRRDVARMEKRINVLMIADADLRDKPYGNPELFFELLRETKVILESQLTELRQGLKEGAFRGN